MEFRTARPNLGGDTLIIVIIIVIVVVGCPRRRPLHCASMIPAWSQCTTSAEPVQYQHYVKTVPVQYHNNTIVVQCEPGADQNECGTGPEPVQHRCGDHSSASKVPVHTSAVPSLYQRSTTAVLGQHPCSMNIRPSMAPAQLVRCQFSADTVPRSARIQSRSDMLGEFRSTSRSTSSGRRRELPPKTSSSSVIVVGRRPSVRNSDCSLSSSGAQEVGVFGIAVCVT